MNNISKIREFLGQENFCGSTALHWGIPVVTLVSLIARYVLASGSKLVASSSIFSPIAIMALSLYIYDDSINNSSNFLFSLCILSCGMPAIFMAIKIGGVFGVLAGLSFLFAVVDMLLKVCPVRFRDMFDVDPINYYSASIFCLLRNIIGILSCVFLLVVSLL